jgi:hypothetical protein
MKQRVGFEEVLGMDESETKDGLAEAIVASLLELGGKTKGEGAKRREEGEVHAFMPTRTPTQRLDVLLQKLPPVQRHYLARETR